MKIKTASVRFKAGPDDGLEEGEFLVYPSTFTKEPDSYGDIVAKGAFVDSLATWKESGDVMPGMYLHDPNQIVAGAIDYGEDDHGWWVKGKFDEDPESQKIYRLVKGRRLGVLSFAYDTLDEGPVELEGGVKANELRKVNVHEFSFLPKGFAANPDTSVVAIKAMADGIKAGRVLSAKNESALREARDSIDSVLAAISDQDEGSAGTGGDDQEKASGQGQAKDETPIGGKSEEPRTAPSARTLATLQLLSLG